MVVPLPARQEIADEVVGWIKLLSLWLEFNEERHDTFTIGFRDFTNAETRSQMIKSVEGFLRSSDAKNMGIGSDDELITNAATAFERHSQAGSPMEHSSHNKQAKKKVAKYISPDEVNDISNSIKAVPHLARLMRVVHGKEQVVLPGSWGREKE